jgi:hypothetical protein
MLGMPKVSNWRSMYPGGDGGPKVRMVSVERAACMRVTAALWRPTPKPFILCMVKLGRRREQPAKMKSAWRAQATG